MQLKTILNRVQKFKSFIYKRIVLQERNGREALIIEVVARRNSKPVCSGCGQRCCCYDTLEAREFEFVPLWGIAVFFVYVMRRANCPRCGVKVERVPWADGKHTLTLTYMQFLAGWAKRLAWKDVARTFHTTWEKVFHSVEWIVSWGIEHRDLSDVTAIGVDEILYLRGHKYLTLVYQINEEHKRLIWIGKDRTVKTLLRFFREFGRVRSEKLEFVCSDMWKPYLKVIAKKASSAVHVLDRFHIAMHMNKAIDQVRAQEARELKAKGVDTLKHSRWCLLKRPANLTGRQEMKLSELLKLNLKTVRCYLLKEDFQLFWNYVMPFYAGRFLDAWCRKVMYSKIDPMKKVARMLRSHRELLLNWFRANKAFSSGVVEGLNNRAKLSIRKAYGFRTFNGT